MSGNRKANKSILKSPLIPRALLLSGMWMLAAGDRVAPSKELIPVTRQIEPIATVFAPRFSSKNYMVGYFATTRDLHRLDIPNQVRAVDDGNATIECEFSKTHKMVTVVLPRDPDNYTRQDMIVEIGIPGGCQTRLKKPFSLAIL